MMAAPSGTVWGSIVGSYGRIGIYTSLTSTDTSTVVSIQVWFWSQYSVSDTGNTLYFDVLTTNTTSATDRGSVSINTTVDSGSGWSTSNQVKLASYSYTYTRAANAVTKYASAKLTNIDRVGGTMSVSVPFTVPKLATYTVSYNANGGSYAPSSQTKTHGVTLTLSSGKATRVGHIFSKWNTASGGTGTSYSPGGSYTANASVTLYAQWTANTYTISYNANGGTGAPSSQTKMYGKALTLSSTKPTRENYKFLGWSTSSAATTAAYPPGSSFATDATTTLYAVWELAYSAPRIYNLTVTRCDFSGNITSEGTCALLSFNWTSDNAGSKMWWTMNNQHLTRYYFSDKTETSGTVSTVLQNSPHGFRLDTTYIITIHVDDGTESMASVTLPGQFYPMDYLAGGRGVGIGKPAELAGVADFGLAAKFNAPVFGNVMGLSQLPEIPANSNFNDYMTTGAWAVYKNTTAATISNIPSAKAGRLEVSSATGERMRLEEWTYLRQRFIPYNNDNTTWERLITRDANNAWNYGSWWRTGLTPTASNKVYHDQKVLWSGAYYMQASHTCNLFESVKSQANGVVLVWSYYSGGSQDYAWTTTYLPKYLVDVVNGGGISVRLNTSTCNTFGTKYIYLNNWSITGNDYNSYSAWDTNSGIRNTPDAFVLRYVIGV